MSSDRNAEALPDREWQVETVRLTGLLPIEDTEAAKSWAEVVGEEPDVTLTHKGIEQRAEGPFYDRKLALRVRPGRVDWVLTTADSGVPDEGGVGTAGKFAECLEIMDEVAGNWWGSEGCPSFQRLALGAVLLFPVADRELGYRVLSTYLPSVKLDAENSRDFSYQINKPRIFRALDIEVLINRLSKWSVAAFQVGAFVVTGGREKMIKGPSMYACRLELDINTDAEFDGELDVLKMRLIFEQLASCAREISEGGETP